MADLERLLTEQRNRETEEIDRLPTAEMLEAINRADREVADAVHAEIPNIANAVDRIAGCLRRGGRLFYQGAGTSGRLGVLDASECPPTFGVDSRLVVGVIAGGERALAHSVEAAEDDPELGARDLKEQGFVPGDALVGIAASGRTPYVLGGLAYARSIGALTVGLSCVPGSEVAEAVDIQITPAVGPEVITGSTRMRAGTATKLVLNMLSTGVMIRLGMVYGNWMVNVIPSNGKLVARAVRIIAAITGIDEREAEALLEQAGSVRTAIVMRKLGVGKQEAEQRLTASGGRLREALGEVRGEAPGEAPGGIADARPCVTKLG